MATPGYGGKILLVNLSKGTGEAAITRLDTEKYKKFGGGYGLGAAMFWDFCVAPGDWDMQGADVVLLARRVEKMQEVAKGIENLGRKCLYLQWRN